ncbi:MAG: chemotaxis response regulator protein-glutamate methylesterase [Pseudomonadota bacterium]
MSGIARRSAPIRALVVDDSMLMRAMIRDALQAEGDITCIGSAKDTVEARRMIKVLNPDVLTLDVEMPGMNGIDFLEKIMTLRPMPVVMVSSLTESGTDTTLAALGTGAVDAVAKPAGKTGPDFANNLRHAVRTAACANIRKHRPAAPAAQVTAKKLPPAPAQNFARRLIAIGASTGGVSAIAQFLRGLQPPLPPMVITQHMPPDYTQRFAKRLDGEFAFDIAEARHGEVLTNNMIRIAPGDRHLKIALSGGAIITQLSDDDPVSGHRPSVDTLLGSIPAELSAKAIGIMLTGMGRDGANGLLEMRKAGAITFGQSEASCVVYGMPRAARAKGAVMHELDIDQLASQVMQAARNSPKPMQTNPRPNGAASRHIPPQIG